MTYVCRLLTYCDCEKINLLAISVFYWYIKPFKLNVMQSKLALGIPFIVFLSIYVSYLIRSSQVDKMANNGLLFISNAAKAHNVCVKASKFVKKVLYINLKESPETTLSVISKQIVNVYSKASARCSHIDIRLMLQPSNKDSKIETSQPIDVVLYDSELSQEISTLQQSVVSARSGCTIERVDTFNVQPDLSTHRPEVKTYEYVALGGTFDRMHNGHKILLSEAVLRATKLVAVGVTDINMIQAKKLYELIEPVEQRIERVLNFLRDINPDLEYFVFPLNNIYGPTRNDPKFQLLIVSEETIKGGYKINEKRKEDGLKPMELHVIGIAPDSDPNRSHEEEEKLSSSNKRMRLLGTYLRPPAPNPNIPDWPYVIGLAGGIASGKSSITEKLKVKGAAIVNCDLIAHELYQPGLPLNQTIADTFGSNVLTSAGEVDRKVLGQIVFSDKSKLEELNSLLWPAILEEANKRIRALGAQGYRVVVMEAAVMVRARWYTHCHQLWAVIIPPEEAVKRLQERNNLTEEEAKQRIASQPSNIEQIAHANIVFSPFWSYEYTQAQIDKAWAHLEELFEKRK